MVREELDLERGLSRDHDRKGSRASDPTFRLLQGIWGKLRYGNWKEERQLSLFVAQLKSQKPWLRHHRAFHNH